MVNNLETKHNKTKQAVQSYAAGQDYSYYNAENAIYYLLT